MDSFIILENSSEYWYQLNCLSGTWYVFKKENKLKKQIKIYLLRYERAR